LSTKPSLANAKPDDKFQFESNGYFVADLDSHKAETPVSNLAVQSATRKK
jgi:glutaminyl-tRNA synthetase